MINIPIYRAKEIDGDEYIIGSLDFNASRVNDTFYYIITGNRCNHTIDPTTIGIHFPDMLDSQGNKIFASLSEDGKGGDIVEYDGGQEIIKYSNGTIQTYMFRFEDLKELNFKAVGIQE